MADYTCSQCDPPIHRPPEPRTIFCMFLVLDDKGRMHGCGYEIEGFTGSMVYSPERDPAMIRHLQDVKHTGSVAKYYLSKVS